MRGCRQCGGKLEEDVTEMEVGGEIWWGGDQGKGE